MKEMKWYESQSEQGISFKLLKKYLERRIKSLSFRSLLVVIYIYIYNHIVQSNRRRSFSYIRVFMKLFLHLEKVKDI